jgi:hypothetical protein
MQLVHSELAREAVDAFCAATEWPHYAKFAYVESVDVAIVGLNRRFWHLELLRFIKEYMETQTGRPFQFFDADVFMGIVEWEDDGAVRIRTLSGPRGKGLSQTVEEELKRVLSP